jgi:ubiquinone/menaquinone biosynthesis C-methylase UbiE
MAEDWGYRSNNEVLHKLVNVRGRFVVDVGCGAGALCRNLAEHGAHVLGVEPDPVQSQKNASAAPVANVGFVQAGAAELPLEPGSVDGVIFSNSLHHIHAPHYEQVFNEVMRVLNNDGWLYVQEPIANGSHHYVMSLFHDETEVRLAAYNALVQYALPNFGKTREIYYDVDTTYENFDEFARRYEHLSYNSYDQASVRDPQVKSRFEEQLNSHGSYTLTHLMRVNVYGSPRF